MKMFVTGDEEVQQNNNMFSSRRIRPLTLKRSSRNIAFKNEARNSNEGCYAKREFSHPIDYCSEDFVRESNSVRFNANTSTHPHTDAINLPMKQERLVYTNNRNTEKSLTSQAMSLPSSHVLRTQSELQLFEDIAAAEWRDNLMFNRLVNGIKENQAKRLERRNKSNYPSTNATFDLGENSDPRVERCLMSIVRHRYEDLQEVSPVGESSLQSPSHLSGGNVIEPDDEDAFEMFQMDDL